MLEYDIGLGDVWNIVIYNDSIPTVIKESKPLLTISYAQLSAEQVARSNRWYRTYADLIVQPGLRII